MRPRVVLDTNVLVSHLLFPGGNPSKILDLAAAGKMTLVLSEDILREMEGVLRAKFGFDPGRAAAAEGSLRAVSEVVRPRHWVEAVRNDESDNRILECALSGKAQVIVTGDKKHLLPLKEFRGVQILSPSEFIRDYIP